MSYGDMTTEGESVRIRLQKRRFRSSREYLSATNFAARSFLSCAVAGVDWLAACRVCGRGGREGVAVVAGEVILAVPGAGDEVIFGTKKS